MLVLSKKCQSLLGTALGELCIFLSIKVITLSHMQLSISHLLIYQYSGGCIYLWLETQCLGKIMHFSVIPGT